MINRTWTVNIFIMIFFSGRRSLWAELSEVKESGILRLNNIKKNKNDFLQKKREKIKNGIRDSKTKNCFKTNVNVQNSKFFFLKIFSLFRSMNEAEKILQESLFEVISSEASYLKSLNILISHFVQSPTLSGPVYREPTIENNLFYSFKHEYLNHT